MTPSTSILKLEAIPKINVRTVFNFVLFLTGLLVSARIAHPLTVSSDNALIWLEGGISVAALFIGGFKYWPAIVLASLVNSSINHTPVLSSVMIATGKTLQAMAGAYLLKKFGISPGLNRVKDMAILFFTAFVVTVIAPAIALSLSWIDRGLNIHQIINAGFTWWLGGVVSLIVMTPLVLSFSKPRWKIANKKEILEIVLIFASLIIAEYFSMFKGVNTFLGISFLYFLVLGYGWLGFRFGPKLVTLSLFVTIGVAIVAVFYGVQPTVQTSIGLRLMQLELFTIVMSMIFYIMSAVSAERKEATEQLKNHVAQLEEALETIKHHAMHDALTGLHNRKALEEQFKIAQTSAETSGRKLAFLFLDLDQFKNVNDTLGHTIGDAILRETSQRLRNSIKEMDTVARLGGDEFIVILNDVGSRDEIESAAKKILNAFDSKICIGSYDIEISTSIGVASYPEAGRDIDALLKSADIALYRAKEQGRGRFVFYDQDMELKLHSKISLEQDLRKAIERKQLELLFQPFVDLKTDKILGVEALLRWNHPVLGRLSPNDFINIAEDTGLIVSIGNWVIHNTCKQIRRWKKYGLDVLVSINLSTMQFAGDSLKEAIVKSLKEYRLDPGNLELEITESAAMENKVQASTKLQELRSMGISVTMDDFGTGYSSLSYLKGLNVQKIKIDRSFVRDIITDEQDATIVRTIISMGHTLGMQVCAEGVETEEQMNLLKAMGCDMAQGYYIYKPMGYEQLLETERSKIQRAHLLQTKIAS